MYQVVLDVKLWDVSEGQSYRSEASYRLHIDQTNDVVDVLLATGYLNWEEFAIARSVREVDRNGHIAK